MKNIAVIYGGQSCEKDISILTGIQTIGKMDCSLYKAYPIFWSEGKMYLPDKYDDIGSYIDDKYDAGKEVTFLQNKLCIIKKNKIKQLAEIECVVLCTHGGSGENGVIQGYFDMLDIPYTSPGVLASSIGMDKEVCKQFCLANDIPILPYIVLNKDEMQTNVDWNIVENKLGYPVIVKPSRQGSSIGINICKDNQELQEALQTAFCYDDKVVVEKALTKFKEINCACIKDKGKVYPSSLEEPIGWQEFLKFEDKYMSGSKNIKMSGGRVFPAKLEQGIVDKIQYITKTLYQKLDCKGIVRCDYLIDEQTLEVYFNEINTIPGSLASYLYEDKGINAKKIITTIIEEALGEKQSKTQAKFLSNVLQYYAKGGSNACKILSKKL